MIMIMTQTVTHREGEGRPGQIMFDKCLAEFKQSTVQSVPAIRRRVGSGYKLEIIQKIPTIA